MAKLNPQQQLFVEEYLTCWNASEAARRAGYKTKASVQGARSLANASIREAIDEAINERAMRANEVLARLTTIASGSLADFIKTDDDGNVTGFNLHKDKPLHLLKKVTVSHGKFGKNISIEIHDPVGALEKLGRYHKLFTDRVELDLTGLQKQLEAMDDNDLDTFINQFSS